MMPKKHYTNVIKNDGPEDAILYRYPLEDFNTGSVVHVFPGEEAVFIKNGHLQGTLRAGTHTLDTSNYPFLSKIANMLSGGISRFSCVIVFYRTASTKEIPWGCNFTISDPIYQIPMELGVGGAYRYSIENVTILMNKLLGVPEESYKKEELNEYVKSEMNQQIKSSIATGIKASKTTILDVQENLSTFGSRIKAYLPDRFSSYGLKLESFSLDRLEIMNSKELEELKHMIAQKSGMRHMGNDWGRYQIAEILKAIAQNPNSGGLANTGAGIGMGLAAMPTVSAMLSQLMDPIGGGRNETNEDTDPPVNRYIPVDCPTDSVTCSGCGSIMPPAARFCPCCGIARCKSCGFTLPQDARFCPGCGTRIEL